jgi:cytochrome c oxidase assembly protein subunit 15
LSPLRAFRVTAGLALATTLLMFGLIVVGSVVRTTGSGLACPDWPLCEGRLIPRFEAHVLIEWFHRLLALLVSLLLLATLAWSVFHREVRARLGGLLGLAATLLFAQILLGALTVWKLLHPAVVSGHLAVALLLFTCMLTTALVADVHGDEEGTRVLAARPPGLLALLAGVTAMVYAQAVLGGIVSTSHAGLACPDWPTCDGQWFPPLRGLQGLQMMHRWGGYAVTLAMMVATIAARSAPALEVRAGAGMALGLTFAQVVLGACNVLLGTPPWLSAAHIATATAILGLMVVTTFRVAGMPAMATQRLVAAVR